MTYVKLVSKPNEWFDVGTEVFEAYMDGYNSIGKPLQRIDCDKYKIWEKAGHILAFGLKDGIWRTELCPLEEFDISYTEDSL
jgi:hypothetical protein